MTRSVLAKSARILIVVVTLALGLWAFWFEPASLRRVSHSIELSNWPTECDGLKIAVLADLHVGSPYNGIDKLQQIIELTQKSKPDIVLLAGDYVIHGVLGGQFVAPEDAAQIISQLSAPAGVYAVLGNHDWWLNPTRVKKALQSHSIPVLEDRAISMRYAQCHFWLVGVSDYWEGPHDLKKALQEVPAGAATVLFTHNPDLFPELPNGINLMIAGHTHGGQVYLPGIGRPVVPSRFGERYAIGHIKEQGRDLFVSPGTGTSIMPVRFLVPPEVSVLTLISSAD